MIWLGHSDNQIPRTWTFGESDAQSVKVASFTFMVILYDQFGCIMSCNDYITWCNQIDYLQRVWRPLWFLREGQPSGLKKIKGWVARSTYQMISFDNHRHHTISFDNPRLHIITPQNQKPIYIYIYISIYTYSAPHPSRIKDSTPCESYHWKMLQPNLQTQIPGYKFE